MLYEKARGVCRPQPLLENEDPPGDLGGFSDLSGIRRKTLYLPRDRQPFLRGNFLENKDLVSRLLLKLTALAKVFEGSPDGHIEGQ